MADVRNPSGQTGQLSARHGQFILTIRVVQDTRIGRLEIDSEAASSCRQYETELVASFTVEIVNCPLSVFVVSVAVDSAILVAAHYHKIFENIQDSRHLSENQNTVSSFLQPLEQLVHHRELATVLHKMFAKRIERAVFNTFKEIRVSAAFTKLHHDVEDRRSVLARRFTSDTVQISQKKLLVKLFLHL